MKLFHLRYLPFILILCVSCPLTLFAQEDIFMSNTTLNDLLNTEVTTASQTQEKLSEAPATILVLTANEIAARGYISLDQLLEDLPEVEIQNKSESISFNWTNIRGVSGNDHFLILLDGIRINSPVGDKMAVVGNYNIANVDRVEIVVGPGSALWGADAYGGVVNIISRQLKPADKAKPLEGRIQAGYGRFGTYDGNGYVQARRGKAALTLTGGLYGTKEPTFPTYYPDNYTWFTNSYSKDSLMQNFGFTQQIVPQPWEMPSRSYYSQVKINWKSLEIGFFANGEMHNTAVSSKDAFTLYSKDGSIGTNIRMEYIKYKIKSKNDKFSGLFQGAYTQYALNPLSRFMNVYTAYAPAWKYSRQYDLSGRAQLSYLLKKDHLLVGGVTFQQTDILAITSDLQAKYGSIADSLQYYANTTISQDFYVYDQTNIGGFAQYQGLFFQKVRVTAGIRADNNSEYGFTFNPRLGLIFAPENKPFSAKLLYGEAFRAPSPQETFQHYGGFPASGNTAFLWRLPNPDLEPEQIRVIEMNASYKKKIIVFDANIYYQSLLNVIEDRQTGNPETFKGYTVLNVIRPVNEGQGTAFGGTIGAKIVTKVAGVSLNVWGYYSYTDGTSGKNNYLAIMPKHSIKTGATITYQRFSLNTRVNLRGKVLSIAADSNGNPLEITPRYALVSTQLRYHIWGKNEQGGTFFLTVRNLLDARYYHPAVSLSDTLMMQVPQDPLRIIGGLSVSF